MRVGRGPSSTLLPRAPPAPLLLPPGHCGHWGHDAHCLAEGEPRRLLTVGSGQGGGSRQRAGRPGLRRDTLPAPPSFPPPWSPSGHLSPSSYLDRPLDPRVPAARCHPAPCGAEPSPVLPSSVHPLPSVRPQVQRPGAQSCPGKCGCQLPTPRGRPLRPARCVGLTKGSAVGSASSGVHGVTAVPPNLGRRKCSRSLRTGDLGDTGRPRKTSQTAPRGVTVAMG